MRVLLYGPLADEFGREVEIDESGGCSVGELRQRLCSARPAATREIGRSRAIIGDHFVGDDHSLSIADLVEFLPPVSGG